MSKDEENKVTTVTEGELELMFRDFCFNTPLKKIAEKYNKSYRQVQRYAADNEWKHKRDLVERGIQNVAHMDQDTLQNEAIDRSMRVLYKVAADTEKALYTGNTDDIPMNLKTMVDAIDKLTRLKMHVQSGGVAQSEVRVKKETFDWNKAIEASIKAKKENGESFDEKEFFEKVIDAEVTKK